MYIVILVSIIIGIVTYYKKEHKDKKQFIKFIEGLFTAFDAFIIMCLIIGIISYFLIGG